MTGFPKNGRPDDTVDTDTSSDPEAADPGSEVAVLVRAAAAGDASAWHGLVDRFTPLVWNICMRYKLPRADAADVCQNVWLRLTERLDTIREPAALAGWLATTARRECLRTFRGPRGEVPSAFEFDVADDVERTDPARSLLQLERQQALLAAMAELPERGRRLLLMLIEDPPRSYKEISDELDIPIGSIGPTRARYLDKLRRSPALAGFRADALPDTHADQDRTEGGPR